MRACAISEVAARLLLALLLAVVGGEGDGGGVALEEVLEDRPLLLRLEVLRENLDEFFDVENDEGIAVLRPCDYS